MDPYIPGVSLKKVLTQTYTSIVNFSLKRIPSCNICLTDFINQLYPNIGQILG